MKRFIGVLLVFAVFCSVFPTFAFAKDKKEEFPHEWDEMHDILADFNELCEEYYVYADDEDAEFIELEEDLSKVKSRYDYAAMRISRLYFDDGYYFYWDDHDCPYYVLYAKYEDQWIIDGILYVEGKIFSYVGVPGESWYFDTNDVKVYWSK